MIRLLVPLLVIVLVAYAPGCVELQYYLQGGLINGGSDDGDGGDGSPGGDSQSPDGDASDALPTVRLDVTNTSPQPNEEVRLTCRLTSGNAVGATYAFQSSGANLTTNAIAGTASLIVSESDAGTEIRVTCTATTDQGTSLPSNRQVIIPTPL